MLRWLWVFTTILLAILVVLQLSQVAELRSEQSSMGKYVFGLEEQATALHKLVIKQERDLLNVTLQSEMFRVERNTCWLLHPAINISAPQKRVDLKDLAITKDAAIISVKELTPGIIAPTGSMYPLLQGDTIVLEKTPENHNELIPGDIIIFESKDTRIIHRIIEIGWDEEGWFAITKGDSNPFEDPFKVRFEDVRGVVVGIIY